MMNFLYIGGYYPFFHSPNEVFFLLLQIEWQTYEKILMRKQLMILYGCVQFFSFYFVWELWPQYLKLWWKKLWPIMFQSLSLCRIYYNFLLTGRHYHKKADLRKFRFIFKFEIFIYFYSRPSHAYFHLLF